MFKRKSKTSAAAAKAAGDKPESAPPESAPPEQQKAQSDDGDAFRDHRQPMHEQQPDLTSCKTEVARRLYDAVNAADDDRIVNRSPDLVPLAKDFEVVRKRLRSLIKAAKDYHAVSQKLTASRAKLVEELAVMATDTPFDDAISKPIDEHTLLNIQVRDGSQHDAHRHDGSSDDAGSSANKKVMTLAKKWEDQHQKQQDMLTDEHTSSLLALSQILQTQSDRHSKHYAESVLDYVTEWEQVVSARVDSELAVCKKLQTSRRHYTQKVETLRNKVNDMEEKCTANNNSNTSAVKNLQAMQEKLERNEEKLNDAWESHETAASRLCVLIEEVTQKGWIDLYPLLQSFMQWESHRCSSEDDVLGPQLSAVQKVLSHAYKKGKKKKNDEPSLSPDDAKSKGKSKEKGGCQFGSSDTTSCERKGLFKKFVLFLRTTTLDFSPAS